MFTVTPLWASISNGLTMSASFTQLINLFIRTRPKPSTPNTLTTLVRDMTLRNQVHYITRLLKASRPRLLQTACKETDTK